MSFSTRLRPDLQPRRRSDIQRAALAGMLWSKQIYLFDVDKWLSEKVGDDSARQARAGNS